MIKPRNSHVKNASLLKRVLREDLKDANDATCLILTVFHGLGALTAKARSPLITSQDVGNKPAHQGTSRLRWAPSIFFPFLGNTLSLTSSWVNLGALVSHGPVPDRFWSSRFFFFRLSAKCMKMIRSASWSSRRRCLGLFCSDENCHFWGFLCMIPRLWSCWSENDTEPAHASTVDA